jgi:hypothetical protein
MTVCEEQMVEWEVAGETEVPGENVRQNCFVHKSHMTWPGMEHVSPVWKAGGYTSEVWHGLTASLYYKLVFR